MDPSPPHPHIGVADETMPSSRCVSREGQQDVYEIQHWDLALLATLAEDGSSGLLPQQPYYGSLDANPTSGSSSSSLTSPSDAASGMGDDSLPSHSDADSTLDWEIASSTISLQQSDYTYIEENGRTYHTFNHGKYVLPNDEAVQERLDLQHHLFLLTFDDLHLAPLPPALHNVLDIGTGTGLWAIEFVSPPNCVFEVFDAEEPWNYHKPFDYIHGRDLAFCFRDPAQVIAKAYDALRPGALLDAQAWLPI